MSEAAKAREQTKVQQNRIRSFMMISLVAVQLDAQNTMLAVSVATLVGARQQQGGLAPRAVVVERSYAVIYVAPGNPSALHKTAFLNRPHSHQRGPRRVGCERNSHFVLVAGNDVHLVGRG